MLADLLAGLSRAVPPVEAAAAALGLACVWLYIRQSLWSWPVGLAQVSLYLFVFLDARLYSDAGLQAVYIVLQAYGWYYWACRGVRQDGTLVVTRLDRRGALLWAAVVLVAAVALGTLTSALGAALPYVDAFASALSLVAQFLIGRKVLESWLMWIVVDIVSIAMYLDRGLYVTAVLYAVFLMLAVRGYAAWRQSRAEALAARPALA